MGTKLTTFSESSKIVAAASKRVYDKYTDSNGNPSYAYAAGYFESMIANMLLDLPKAKQEYYIELLKGE
ncbi:hypothetical protein EBT25_10475 [bacterium]|jgi:hypothetical protein|nr:hypothetical protein [bacterium]